jgi:hypothetical protein
LGRWISRDPLPNAEILQGPNPYAYVGNNTPNVIDPRGESVTIEVAGLLFLIAIGVYLYQVYEGLQIANTLAQAVAAQNEMNQDLQMAVMADARGDEKARDCYQEAAEKARQKAISLYQKGGAQAAAAALSGPIMHGAVP